MQVLYILGDFFDTWIGDDDDRPLANDVAAALRQIVQGGCEVLFMHGNRDFLLGSAYSARCGMKILPEIHARADACFMFCLLYHLCTLDQAYQSFRAQVRNPQWQAQFLAQPLNARRAFAAQARAQSQAHQRELMASIADVDPVAVIEMQLAYPKLAIIHGHTHRPGVHQTAHGKRIVLGDWRANEPSWLALDGSQGNLVAHSQHWRVSL